MCLLFATTSLSSARGVFPMWLGVNLTERFVRSRFLQHQLARITTFYDSPLHRRWISFFSPNSPTGIGTIRLFYGNFLRGGGQATTCYEGTYVYNSPPNHVYWVRGLVYPFGSVHGLDAVLVQEGNLYAEKNAYVIYRVGKKKENRFVEMEHYAKRRNSPPLVAITG